jgi:uncharacterized membrane protein
VENKTEIFVCIYLRSIKTSRICFARIISASIMIITIYRKGNTSNIGETIVCIALIFVPTFFRDVSYYASIIFITVSRMTFIGRSALI